VTVEVNLILVITRAQSENTRIFGDDLIETHVTLETCAYGTTVERLVFLLILAIVKGGACPGKK
jgi:hypothetical protein